MIGGGVGRKLGVYHGEQLNAAETFVQWDGMTIRGGAGVMRLGGAGIAGRVCCLKFVPSVQELHFKI